MITIQIIAKLRFDINFEISLSLRLAIYTALQRKGGRRGVEDLYKNSSNSSNFKMTLIQFMHGNYFVIIFIKTGSHANAKCFLLALLAPFSNN